MHRTKSILAAIAAVALSATAVFAAAGTAPADAARDGLARAALASEKSVPVSTGKADAVRTTRAPEGAETPKAPRTPDVDATTGSNGPHPDNHGKAVSEAAHAVTPAGFANHGAYVRSIATNNAGHPTTPGAATAKTHGKSGEAHPAN